MNVPLDLHIASLFVWRHFHPFWIHINTETKSESIVITHIKKHRKDRRNNRTTNVSCPEIKSRISQNNSPTVIEKNHYCAYKITALIMSRMNLLPTLTSYLIKLPWNPKYRYHVHKSSSLDPFKQASSYWLHTALILRPWRWRQHIISNLR
jgi:hypothetical protein